MKLMDLLIRFVCIFVCIQDSPTVYKVVPVNDVRVVSIAWPYNFASTHFTSFYTTYSTQFNHMIVLVTALTAMRELQNMLSAVTCRILSSTSAVK
jgi:hypothetical protein